MLKVLLRNFRFLLLSAVSPQFLAELKNQIGEDEYNYLLAKREAMPVGELERTLTILLETSNSRLQSPYPTLQLELALARILKPAGFNPVEQKYT